MRTSLYLAVSLVIGVSSARADEPWLLFDGCHWTMPRLCEQWRKRCWCADDYCRKALPEVPCNPKGCGDDYCGKPLPVVPCNARGCGDDYCPRTCPLYLGPACEPWYRCGPGNAR
jgi:hypothetical protein